MPSTESRTSPGARRFRECGRGERDDLGDLQAPGALVLGRVEAEAERGPKTFDSTRPGAEMPQCEAFSSPIIRLTIRRISSERARAGDAWLVLAAHGLPVDAVELRIEEPVVQVRPGLMKDLPLLRLEFDVELGRDGDVLRLALLDRDGLDAVVVQVEDVLAVGRELRARSWSLRWRSTVWRPGAPWRARPRSTRRGSPGRLQNAVKRAHFPSGLTAWSRISNPAGTMLRRCRMPSNTISVGFGSFFLAASAASAGLSALSDLSGSFAVAFAGSSKSSRNWSSRNFGARGVRSMRTSCLGSVRWPVSKSR